MADDSDKVILTNISVLKQKYGAQGYNKLQAAVKQLIASDQKRGLKTIQVGVDDATAMGKLKAKPVTDPASARQNKAAIDGVYKSAKKMKRMERRSHAHTMDESPVGGSMEALVSDELWQRIERSASTKLVARSGQAWITQGPHDIIFVSRRASWEQLPGDGLWLWHDLPELLNAWQRAGGGRSCTRSSWPSSSRPTSSIGPRRGR